MCRMIYKPKGRALEYSPWALNIYNGCSHGCKYCYAPAVMRRQHEDFTNNVTPRANFTKKLKEEMKKDNSHIDGNVLLSFTSDCYQEMEHDLGLTRLVIEQLNSAGLPVTVLTKNARATNDFDILRLDSRNEFAMTLTCVDDEQSREWEPGASLPSERMNALKQAHDLGIRTWVSFEPVVDPRNVYKLIELTHKYVDFYKVGVLNHHKHASSIDWKEFKTKAVKQLRHFKCDYMLKDDLKKL